jgi:hypothetical protein
MFESMEIRKAKNGIIVTVQTEDGTEEYIFATPARAMKFVKNFVEGKNDSAE